MASTAKSGQGKDVTEIQGLFMHFLKDIYYAERQIVKALPKMAKAAQTQELKDAFLKHRDESQHQIERLQQVFEKLGKRAQGVTCEAMNGLIEEGEELLEESEAGPARDAGLIAGAQAIEHYEIARYGALVAWAKVMGQQEVAQLLQETLDEEKKTDSLLNEIANRHVNEMAKAA